MIQHEVPSSTLPNKGRYAVVLNPNAKRWNGNLHQEILRWVPRNDLYLTEDFAQANLTIQKILSQRYDAVFTGGGDGTITFLVNQIEAQIQQGLISRDEAPPVGILKMGTGNALAHWTEADDILQDLKRLRGGAPLIQYNTRMISDGERIFPFAGFGWDAEILNDYNSLKNKVEGSVAEPFLTGMLGYATSVSLRTVPRQLFQKPLQIRVTALDDAIEIRPDGSPLSTHGAGEILFEGHSKIFGAGSIPYWGYEIRMFPHANAKPGYFQFRTYNGSIPQILRSLPKFWKGEIEHYCHDFLCKEIQIDIQHSEMNYQVAGDAAGGRRQVTWKMHPTPVPLVVTRAYL